MSHVTFEDQVLKEPDHEGLISTQEILFEFCPWLEIDLGKL